MITPDHLIDYLNIKVKTGYDPIAESLMGACGLSVHSTIDLQYVWDLSVTMANQNTITKDEANRVCASLLALRNAKLCKLSGVAIKPKPAEVVREL